MSREAFEAWCCNRWGGDRGALTIREDGEYLNGPVHCIALNARQAAALEEAAEVCDRQHDRARTSPGAARAPTLSAR